jgi:hypothetical protein
MEARPNLQSLLDLTFFGLTSELAPQIRFNLFSHIHEIVFHSQGGYDWETVYNMPIWLRKFTYNKMKEYYNKQNTAQNEDLGAQSQKIKDGKVDIPSHFKGKLGKAPKY